MKRVYKRHGNNFFKLWLQILEYLPRENVTYFRFIFLKTYKMKFDSKPRTYQVVNFLVFKQSKKILRISRSLPPFLVINLHTMHNSKSILTFKWLLNEYVKKQYHLSSFSNNQETWKILLYKKDDYLGFCSLQLVRKYCPYSKSSSNPLWNSKKV